VGDRKKGHLTRVKTGAIYPYGIRFSSEKGKYGKEAEVCPAKPAGSSENDR